MPPLSEQAAIVRFLDHADRRIRRYIRTMQKLTGAASRVDESASLIGEFRSRLIADVVTGKLDVREAAARLPELDGLADENETDTTAAGGAVAGEERLGAEREGASA